MGQSKVWLNPEFAIPLYFISWPGYDGLDVTHDYLAVPYFVYIFMSIYCHI